MNSTSSLQSLVGGAGSDQTPGPLGSCKPYKYLGHLVQGITTNLVQTRTAYSMAGVALTQIVLLTGIHTCCAASLAQPYLAYPLLAISVQDHVAPQRYSLTVFQGPLNNSSCLQETHTANTVDVNPKSKKLPPQSKEHSEDLSANLSLSVLSVTF